MTTCGSCHKEFLLARSLNPKCHICGVLLCSVCSKPVCVQCSCHNNHADPYILTIEFLSYKSEPCSWKTCAYEDDDDNDIGELMTSMHGDTPCRSCACQHTCQAVSVCRACFAQRKI